MIRLEANSASVIPSPVQGPMDMETPQGWVQRGESAFESGDFPEARRCFERASSMNPFMIEALVNLSAACWRLGETDDSLSALSRALEIDPNNPSVIINCSRMFKMLGRTEDAKDILNAYLRRNPFDWEVRTALENIDDTPVSVQMPVPAAASSQKPQAAPANGNATFFNEQGKSQYEKGNVANARACFEMAIENDPGLAKSYSNLGVLLLEEGDIRGSLQYLEKALDLDPQDTDVLFNSAQALTVAGELQMAADVYQIYLRNHPNDDQAWDNFVGLLRQAASGWSPQGLNGEVARTYLTTGRDLARLGDTIGASQAFQRVVMLDAANADAFYELANLHLSLNQTSEALEMLRDALRVNPTHQPSVLKAGELLAASGRAAEASDIYRMSLAQGEDPQIRSALNAVSPA